MWPWIWSINNWALVDFKLFIHNSANFIWTLCYSLSDNLQIYVGSYFRILYDFISFWGLSSDGADGTRWALSLDHICSIWGSFLSLYQSLFSFEANDASASELKFWSWPEWGQTLTLSCAGTNLETFHSPTTPRHFSPRALRLYSPPFCRAIRRHQRARQHSPRTLQPRSQTPIVSNRHGGLSVMRVGGCQKYCKATGTVLPVPLS